MLPVCMLRSLVTTVTLPAVAVAVPVLFAEIVAGLRSEQLSGAEIDIASGPGA